MRLIRRLFLLTCILAACGVVWAAIHARQEGFSSSWRNAIEREFAARGYHVDIGKLTLGAFRGLVAEDVRFFLDASRQQEIAYVDAVFLDVDLSHILKKQILINSMEIQNAQLNLPIDPTKTHNLRITGVSGKIVVTESVIEVIRAEASVGPVSISLKGSLGRPDVENSSKKKKIDQQMTQRRMTLVADFLLELANFEIVKGHPHAEIEFRGDWDDFSTISAKGEVSIPAFMKKGLPYRIESLEAKGSFVGQEDRVTLEALKIRDEKGVFNLSGEWRKEKNQFGFSVSSTADLVGMASLFRNDNRLGEIVFFNPPTLEASGFIDLTLLRQREIKGFPGEISGEFRAERFGTRGQVFTGGSCGFSIAGERFYLRNVRLDHKTGVAFLNLKYESGAGDETIRYQTEIRMDPLVFRPFLNDRGRKVMEPWNFGDSSTIYIAAVGQGGNWDFATWKNRGVIDLRNFRLNGVEFERLETDYESEEGIQWFRNSTLIREEGKVTIELAKNTRAEKLWELKGVVSSVDPVAGVGAFSPKVGTLLEKYRFSKPPTIHFSGVLDARTEEEIKDQVRRTDVQIAFSGGEAARYDFLGKTLTLENPTGDITIKGAQIHLKSLKASVLGGALNLDYQAKDSRNPDSPFSLEARVRDLPLSALMHHYGEREDIDGDVDADIAISGRFGQVNTFEGGGGIRITKGHLFSIPILGPLSKLLPNKGENGAVATEAAATYRIEKGVLSTDNLEALSKVFRVKAAGTISLVDQSVDLEAVVNTREELSQAVLTPLSELLTFSCTGTVRNPVWRSKHISALAKVPATLISELTNIPIEGLKKLGQLGQVLFAPLNREELATSHEQSAEPSAAEKRRFPWGKVEGDVGSRLLPRKLFQSQKK